jgi:hypothetical protein
MSLFCDQPAGSPLSRRGHGCDTPSEVGSPKSSKVSILSSSSWSASSYDPLSAIAMAEPETAEKPPTSKVRKFASLFSRSRTR